MTWRRIDYDSTNMSGIMEEDLRNYYQKFDVKLVGIEMVAPGKAIVSFSNCNDAQFCLAVKEVKIKNHSIWQRPFKAPKVET